MNKKLSSASSLPLLAEYHAHLNKPAGFDRALGAHVPSVSAREASHLESAANLSVGDCADAIELLAMLLTSRPADVGDGEEIAALAGSALRIIGSALQLAHNAERTAGAACEYHAAKARQHGQAGE